MKTEVIKVKRNQWKPIELSEREEMEKIHQTIHKTITNLVHTESLLRVEDEFRENERWKEERKRLTKLIDNLSEHIDLEKMDEEYWEEGYLKKYPEMRGKLPNFKEIGNGDFLNGLRQFNINTYREIWEDE
tara:strand:+ start:70 stop:462 length:393 start_codon:yes stop_codon:yes gene_type:complete